MIEEESPCKNCGRHKLEFPRCFKKCKILSDFQFHYNIIKNIPYANLTKSNIQKEVKMKFSLDPSEEFNNIVMDGVQHKYKSTVLILTTNKCFQYCKYCFRKRNFDNIDEICKNKDYPLVFEYLKKHGEISNVLLSGGDPLTLSIDKLEYIIKNIPEHLQIRLGTRALTYKPKVFIPIVNLLKSRNIQIIAHINNAEELQNNNSIEIIELLRNNGISIRSQTVLLKGINDTVQSLFELYRFITKLGIFPYYLFQCRPVTENERFIVPFIEGLNLIKNTRKCLSGLEKSFRFILSSRLGKIEILDFDEQTQNLIYRFHQSKDINLVDKLFQININNNESWINHIQS